MYNNEEIYKVAITNRHLCKGDLAEKITSLTQYDMVILREKDLSAEEYLNLATNIIDLHDNILLHTFIEVAKNLSYKKIHLPFEVFKTNDISYFDIVGVSVHSLEEAIFTEENGASFIIYGHIFQTDCKKDLKPRGTEVLAEICHRVDIPVYAIGGINDKNIELVKKAGAKGICKMSSAMI